MEMLLCSICVFCYLEGHENNEISDELVNPSKVELLARHRLLCDQAVRQAVEETVLKGSVQNCFVIVL